MLERLIFLCCLINKIIFKNYLKHKEQLLYNRKLKTYTVNKLIDWGIRQE